VRINGLFSGRLFDGAEGMTHNMLCLCERKARLTEIVIVTGFALVPHSFDHCPAEVAEDVAMNHLWRIYI